MKGRIFHTKTSLCVNIMRWKVIIFPYLPHPNHLVFSGKGQYYQSHLKKKKSCDYMYFQIYRSVWGSVVHVLESLLFSGDHPFFGLYNLLPCTKTKPNRNTQQGGTESHSSTCNPKSAGYGMDKVRAAV